MKGARSSPLSLGGELLLGPEDNAPPKPLSDQGVEPASPSQAQISPPPRSTTSLTLPDQDFSGFRAAPRYEALSGPPTPPQLLGQTPETFPEHPSSYLMAPYIPDNGGHANSPFPPRADNGRGGLPACPNKLARDWLPPYPAAHVHWFTLVSRFMNQ